MNTPLHPIVREFLLIRSIRLKTLQFIKVEEHQDHLYGFEHLTFLDYINAKCDARAKTLILDTAEEETIPFPLTLSSVCVMNTCNQLMLNHPKDIRLQAHLIKCEKFVSKSLKISNIISM